MSYHVRALGQCRRVIREHGLRGHVAGDTASRQAGVNGTIRRAPRFRARALSAPSTASTYLPKTSGTPRTTRRLRHPVENAGLGGAATARWSSFVFRRLRNVPAALYKALGGFATNGVNMTKLNPTCWKANHGDAPPGRRDAIPDDPFAGAGAGRAGSSFPEVRILGVYPAHPFRIEAQKKAV